MRKTGPYGNRGAGEQQTGALPKAGTGGAPGHAYYAPPAPKQPAPCRPALRRRGRRHLWLAAGALLLCCGLGVAALLLGGAQAAEAGAGAPQGSAPWTIALDAGHGGGEVGAQGLIDEIQLTEATVRQLESLLAQDPNFNVVLTRAYGQAADINSRIAAAERAGATLLFSVHGNSEPTGRTRGFECFAPPPGRAFNAEGLALGRLVAAEMAAAGSALRGNDGVRYLYFEADGQGDYNRVIRESDARGKYAASSYALLDRAVCPSLLAEQCFVTNAEDVGAFGTPKGCALAAACYYRAICA